MNNTLTDNDLHLFPTAFLKSFNESISGDVIFEQLCQTSHQILLKHTKHFSGGTRHGDDTQAIQDTIRDLGESCRLALRRKKLLEYKRMDWNKKTRLVYAVTNTERVLCAVIYHYSFENMGLKCAELVF
jgi:hypothetical protein